MARKLQLGLIFFMPLMNNAKRKGVPPKWQEGPQTFIHRILQIETYQTDMI